jgi:hypothetical protein
MDIEPIVGGQFIQNNDFFSKSAKEFLSTIKIMFPEVSTWKGFGRETSYKTEFKVEISNEDHKNQKSALDSTKLWEQTIEYFKKNRFDTKELGIMFYPFSYQTRLNCEVLFGSDAFNLNIGENKEGEVDEFVEKHKNMLVDLVKRFGKCEGIGEAWMFRNRAFAGQPYRLYELNLISDWEKDYAEDLREKTAYREQMKKFVDVDYARKVLVEEIGVEKFEDLGNGRIYVEFGGTWLTDFDAIEDYWDMEMDEREKIPTENNPRLDKWQEIVERKVAEAKDR